MELRSGPPVGNVRFNVLDAPDLLSVVTRALRCVRKHTHYIPDLGRLLRALRDAKKFLQKHARKLLFFRPKRRHKVKDFQAYSLKLDLFNVKTARKTFRYEIDLSEKRKYDFVKIGSFKLEDSERLVKLIKEVDAYVNGRR